jgi:translocation and assembly module TamA
MVDIRFAGQLAQQQFMDRMNRLRRQWSLRPGERFRQDDWSSAKNGVLKNLLVQDYPAATIADSQARIDPERRIADLSVEYNSGPPFTFGELQVRGLDRYSRALIDELNPIRPGDPYSQEKLSELQSRLLDTGYFRTAFASVDIDPAHPQDVPVRLDLAENPRKRLSFGTGFSTDAGVRIETKYLDRKFLDRNLRLESDALLDRETRRLGGGLFFPALRNGWHPIADARYERTDISGELLDTLRIGARVTSPIRTDESSWGITYFADRQRVDTAANDRQALLVSYSYTRRRLDNILNPRSGYVASLTVGAGPQGVINAANIGRVLGNVNLLTQYGRRWQTVLRAQVGQVLGASRFDVPSALLFRTGGDQTVRGYSFNSLGVPQGSAVVGGRVVGVASAEAIYWFRPEWGVAAFHDMGDATDSWRDFKLNHGTGVGARWRSPIGPVSVDLAYGHTTRKPRLHFSVGYGF